MVLYWLLLKRSPQPRQVQVRIHDESRTYCKAVKSVVFCSPSAFNYYYDSQLIVLTTESPVYKLDENESMIRSVSDKNK